MVKIPLTQNKFTLIDDEDFERVNQFKWHFVNGKYGGYARRTLNPKPSIGRYKHKDIYLHAFLLKPSKNMMVDHINHDTLDNRKDNLRIVTASENAMNRKKRNDNTTGYIGINIEKGKYRVSIRKDGKTFHFGGYTNIQHAWLARRWAERLYFKDNAFRM